MSVFHFPSESAALLLSIIKNYAPSCSVYVFGYRTSTLCSSGLFATATSAAVAVAHFDLVVFTTKVVVNGALNISTAISEQSKNTITASVLLHKVSDLATTQPGQQWFFNTVLCRGQRLCIAAASPPYLLANAVPERNCEVADESELSFLCQDNVSSWKSNFRIPKTRQFIKAAVSSRFLEYFKYVYCYG